MKRSVCIRSLYLVLGIFSAERHQHDGFDLTPGTFDTTGAPYRRYDLLAKLQRQFTPSFSLEGLVTAYHNEMAGRSNGELGPQEGTNRVRDAAGGHEADTAVVWAQHRWIVSNRVTTTVGARVDRRSRFETAVSPKLAANVRVTDNLSARASYGRGFRAPDLGQHSSTGVCA